MPNAPQIALIAFLIPLALTVRLDMLYRAANAFNVIQNVHNVSKVGVLHVWILTIILELHVWLALKIVLNVSIRLHATHVV